MEKSELTNNLRKSIGKQLRAIRDEQGWSVSQVALMAGVKDKTIEKIEAGSFNVPIDVLAKVADVFGVDIAIKSRTE